MSYVCWSAIYEGASDDAYFNVLIPRVMDELILTKGIRNSTVPTAPAIKFSRGSVEVVAAQVCEAKQAFHLIFIHADTGGRALETGLAGRSTEYCEALSRLCDWPPARCITVIPRHETEAWALADPQAVTEALGYSGHAHEIGLPANAGTAERLVDPKATLAEAGKAVRGRRSVIPSSALFPAIAQRQSLQALRASKSFRDFETKVALALKDLGCTK